MPNGKLGDHPLTDILIHEQSLYGEKVCKIVRKMSEHSKFSDVRDHVESILLKQPPSLKNDPEREYKIRETIEDLEKLQQRLASN